MSKDPKYKELVENDPCKDDAQNARAAKRGSFAVIAILLILVTVVSTIMYLVEISFGRQAGTVALIVLAVVIAAYLYRNEIREKFKRK